MKTLKRILSSAFICLVGVASVSAQDVGFSQFFANPLYLNPAFAGSKVAPRVSINYRLQWPGMVSAFHTASASYDMYVPSLHGGVGAYLMTDAQGDHGAIQTTDLAGMYSFRFQISSSLFVNMALQATVCNTSLDWNLDELRFGDQIDPVNGFIYNTTAQAPDQTSKWYADFSGGMLMYTERFYLGIALAHLNRPNQGFYSEDRIPTKFTANLGMLLNIAEERRRTSSLGLGTPVISPNIIYQKQGELMYYNFGIYLDWMPFMVGLWYRGSDVNPDAFVFQLGVQKEHIKFGYSYDVTVSQLANNTAGAHEFSLGFLLPVPQEKMKIHEVNCPSF